MKDCKIAKKSLQKIKKNTTMFYTKDNEKNKKIMMGKNTIQIVANVMDRGKIIL
jgi:hypothetical protein